MATTNPLLPLTGKDVAITIFIGKTPLPQTDLAKSVSVDEVVTQSRDDYLNRDFSRTDEQTDGHDVKLELDYASSNLLNALIAQKEKRRLRQPFDQISIAMTLQARDGSYHGWQVTNITSKVGFSFRGRKERGMISLDLQGEELKPVDLS